MFLTVSVLLWVVCLVWRAAAADENFAADVLEGDYGRIIYTTVIFRHGDRELADPYPNDPFPLTVWKNGVGELTKIGKNQEYISGQWFRKRYEKPLNITGYRSNEVRMVSSDVNRTIMSAELVLAGFYPPNEREIWTDDDIRWQPVPIHTIPKAIDNMISVGDVPCDRYQLERLKFSGSPVAKAFREKYADVISYAAMYSGFELPSDDIFATVTRLSYLYVDLWIEERNNFTLPTWTKTIYPEPLRTISEFSFAANTATEDMKRLRTGPFLKTIVNEMLMQKSNPVNMKIRFYSAHDTTIVSFLDTLGIYNHIHVPYGASVLLELRLNRAGEYIITVLYRNSTTERPYLLQVPDCEASCKLDTFVKLMQNVMPTIWADECGLRIYETLFYYNFGTSVVLIIILATFSFGCVSYMVKKTRRREYEAIRDIPFLVD